MAHDSNRNQKQPKDENGQALVLFVFGLVVMLGTVAMSIDVGRVVWARTQMQSAVDAAALAAAQSLPDQTAADLQAETYFVDNSGFIQSQATAIQFSTAYPANSKSVVVTGDADLPTYFARIFGIDSFHVNAEGEAESVVIDAVVVLDRSGSMCWDSHGPDGNYVGQVRLFSAIDATVTSFQVRKDDPSLPLSHYLYVGQVSRLDSAGGSEWLEITNIIEPDMVEVLRGVNDPDDGTPSTATGHSASSRFQGDSCQQAGAAPYYPWEYVKSGAKVFTNQMDSRYDQIGYVHFSTSAVLEMGITTSHNLVLNAIDGSPDPTAGGNGDGLTNIAHGFYVANQELITSGRANAESVVVLLSDGVANRYCTPSDHTATCPSQGTNAATARSRALAQADYAAANGITVYTIGYGNSSDDGLMQDIADRTGGTFYKVPTENDLAAAFIAIAEATQVRLTR